MVRHPGYRTITTQLYFAGGDWLESDVPEAVKPELVLEPTVDGSGACVASYDFELEPEA